MSLYNNRLILEYKQGAKILTANSYVESLRSLLTKVASKERDIMGCYLSKVDDKVYITEGKGRNFQYCSASCQGWRREQEDAEICISDFDENASLFVLCDGHGGAEVAKYTVAHLPDFIKNHRLYIEGKYEELLKVALIDFDAHLRTDEVMAELEKISNDDEKTDEDNLAETNSRDMPQGSASTSSVEQAAGSSSGACASTSSFNGLSSVAEDVDTETLRREAQLPLDVLIHKYADAATRSRIVSLNKMNKNSLSEEKDEAKPKLGGDDLPDQPEPSSSKTSLDDGPSSTNGDLPVTGLDLFKKVYMEHFDDSEDDSEFEGSGESDSDEDSDDDGDDERDEETPGSTSKKTLSKKHRRKRNSTDSSHKSKDDDVHEESSTEDDSDEDEEDADEEEASDEDEEQDEEDEEVDDEEADDDDNLSVPLLERLNALRGQKKSKQQALKVHRPGMDSGCTVVVALLKDMKLYVASAGDSRCIVVMRDGGCKPMTSDHKPEDTQEKKRILLAGGYVCEGRVNGGLNLSRALGDFSYKDQKLEAKDQMITPCPDVTTTDINTDDVGYIFLACDGIWNSYDDAFVSKFIVDDAESTKDDLAAICAALFKKCLAPNCNGDGTGCDNMTCILVKFDSSNLTSSCTKNQIDLKLETLPQEINSSDNEAPNNVGQAGAKGSEQKGDCDQSGLNEESQQNEVKQECDLKQSAKRQHEGETGCVSDNKRRCLYLLSPQAE